tara:strand:+ start:6718 stop:7680 length:963 start_codon:yes stop_codon:yes gene_type:complete
MMKLRRKEVKAYPVPNREGLTSSYNWNPAMTDKVILRVSKSSLGAYNFCSQQYFIKYILGVKEPQNDAMVRGSNVHDATEDFYNDIDVGHAVSMRSYGYEKVLEYFKEFIPDSNPERGTFALDEQSHLEKLFEAEAKRFMTCDSVHFLPVGNEVTLDAVVEIEGVQVHLTGIVDRIFMDEHHDVHIHELKTGAWKHKPSKRVNMQKEMAYYVYLMNVTEHEMLGGVNAAYWGWDHTAGLLNFYDDKVYRFIETVKADAIRDMMADLKALVRSHKRYNGTEQDDSAFPLKDLGAVRFICEPWCRLKGYCSRYGRVAIHEEE